MAPINVPEGFVAVKREPGVAAALLEAADRIGADRKAGVRTTSSGVYHVADDIAAEYQSTLPETDEVEVGEDGQPLTDEQKAAAAAEAEAAEKAAQERGYPDGNPNADWTVAHLEAWAEAQDPKVDLGTGNKPDKLKAAVDSLAAK
jgi:hypothetical protein